jgi:DNA repair exonuclease SbcCD ATPase subunit
MAKPEKNVPELVRAAESLESEIANLEAQARATRKIPLNSERNITRAAKELAETAQFQERLAAGLQALASAMAQLQARQQAALEPLAAFATETQTRMQRLSEHMHAFGLLGAAAGEVTALIQSGGDRAEVVTAVDAQLTSIENGARALLDVARNDDYPDVVREADSLKQRVAALRKKLDPKL